MRLIRKRGTLKKTDMRTFMSVVTADYFQYYIPLYVTIIRLWFYEDIWIFVRGEIDSKVRKLVADKNCTLVDNSFMSYPNLISTTNSLRFVVGCREFYKRYQQILITDIDLLIFYDPFPWHCKQITADQPFSGHHGPYHKPRRPEVSASWTGDFERVAGGFFCVTPEWYRRTEEAINRYAEKLEIGVEGNYRENDEVILARIIKESGMQTPKDKYFPPQLRGIHLGDFKETMTHRWTDKLKMRKKLTSDVLRRYSEFKKTNQWKDMVKEINNEEINQELENLETYMVGVRF